jgi:hypothetical protein
MKRPPTSPRSGREHLARGESASPRESRVPCSPHEDRRQARVAGDSILVAIVLTCENASCRPLRGLRISKDTIHPRLHGPKARALALGYLLSPTTWATPAPKCLAIYLESLRDGRLNHRESRF